MSNSAINNISFFNSENIAIFPKDESMKGIFAFLKYLDGSYESRYKIEANTSYGVSSDLVKYFDTSEGYVLTSAGKYDINITFQTLFYPTHYSLVNAGSDSVGSHTYNKDWDFVGIDDEDNEYILDRQRNNTFCDNYVCQNSIIKTLEIKRPMAFKKFVLRTMKGGNSYSENGKDYFILKAIEFFGILCPQNSECHFFRRHTCGSKIFSINNKLLLFSMLLSSK